MKGVLLMKNSILSLLAGFGFILGSIDSHATGLDGMVCRVGVDRPTDLVSIDDVLLLRNDKQDSLDPTHRHAVVPDKNILKLPFLDFIGHQFEVLNESDVMVRPLAFIVSDISHLPIGVSSGPLAKRFEPKSPYETISFHKLNTQRVDRIKKTSSPLSAEQVQQLEALEKEPNVVRENREGTLPNKPQSFPVDVAAGTYQRLEALDKQAGGLRMPVTINEEPFTRTLPRFEDNNLIKVSGLDKMTGFQASQDWGILKPARILKDSPNTLAARNHANISDDSYIDVYVLTNVSFMDQNNQRHTMILQPTFKATTQKQPTVMKKDGIKHRFKYEVDGALVGFIQEVLPPKSRKTKSPAGVSLDALVFTAKFKAIPVPQLMAGEGKYAQ